MIKLILELDYEDIRRDDLIRALYVDDAYSCIDDIQNIFRSIEKYGCVGDREIKEGEYEILYLVQDEICRILKYLPARD
jgi:hypothetical protein